MTRARLPNRRNAQIAMFEHGGRRYRATFGIFSNGALAEVFLDSGKADSTLQQHADDVAVLVSLLLQNGVSPDVIQAIDLRADPHCVGHLAVREGEKNEHPALPDMRLHLLAAATQVRAARYAASDD